MIIPKVITAKSLLDKISFIQSTRYNHLYYNNAEINKDSIIYEHINDQNILFVASTENTPPPKHFFVNFYKHKKIIFPIGNNNAKDVEKKPLDPVIPSIPAYIKNEHKFTFYFTGGSKEF